VGSVITDSKQTPENNDQSLLQSIQYKPYLELNSAFIKGSTQLLQQIENKHYFEFQYHFSKC